MDSNVETYRKGFFFKDLTCTIISKPHFIVKEGWRGEWITSSGMVLALSSTSYTKFCSQRQQHIFIQTGISRKH